MHLSSSSKIQGLEFSSTLDAFDDRESNFPGLPWWECFDGCQAVEQARKYRVNTLSRVGFVTSGCPLPAEVCTILKSSGACREAFN